MADRLPVEVWELVLSFCSPSAKCSLRCANRSHRERLAVTYVEAYLRHCERSAVLPSESSLKGWRAVDGSVGISESGVALRKAGKEVYVWYHYVPAPTHVLRMTSPLKTRFQSFTTSNGTLLTEVHGEAGWMWMHSIVGVSSTGKEGSYVRVPSFGLT